MSVLRRKLRNIGPGAIVAAAFIGPGTVTTATFAGSSYGYTLLWAIAFSIFATFILQEMASRLGIAGRMGVGEAIRQKAKRPFIKWGAYFLVIGAIVIGNAAYEAGNITGAVLGFQKYGESISLWGINPLVIIIGIFAFLLLLSGKYKVIEKSLIVMVSIMGIVFLASAIFLQPDLGKVLQGLFTPVLPEGSLMMVIGLIGTTVVPYNLFLHASTVKEKWKEVSDLKTAYWDTLISVIGGGIITMAILITSSIAFEGKAKATSMVDLSYQLTPLLGNWSEYFIAIGFLAAGLSSSITAPLAAAFATSEIMGWKSSLKGNNFRSIWIFVLVTGIVFSSLGFNPTSVILFAQVANGMLLPVIAIFLVWVMNDKIIMGDHINSRLVNLLGILVIIVTLILGLKGILSATNFL